MSLIYYPVSQLIDLYHEYYRSQANYFIYVQHF